MDTYESLFEHLSKYNQQHLVKYWKELNNEERLKLVNDIKSINFDEICKYFKEATQTLQNGCEKLDNRMEPVPHSQFESTININQQILDSYYLTGLEEISRGRVGVLLMAGGQGTRLGVSYPKGMYDIGLPSHKSLFQVQAERIRKLQQLAKSTFKTTDSIITWYIMTSQHTMTQTETFFQNHNYFNLDKKNIMFFEQGLLPCFDFDGNILLDEKDHVSQAPDGNGGIYRALRDNGILNDMKSRGIKYLHAHSVDNILIKIADPIFIGYCSIKDGDCVAKVVEKNAPNEAVGVVCKVDGKYQVVEYSEITEKTANLRREDGTLVFKDGNICNHLFTLDFLQKVADKFETQLKLHVAKKKIAYVNEDGIRCAPSQPNGIKIEKFVFDVFEFAQNFLILEVDRDEEFSALKNADSAGKDCPKTARQDLFKLHKKFIEINGGKVDGSICEISPLLSYAGEGLKEYCEGKEFSEPVLLLAPVEKLVYMNGNNN